MKLAEILAEEELNNQVHTTSMARTAKAYRKIATLSGLEPQDIALSGHRVRRMVGGTMLST